MSGCVSYLLSLSLLGRFSGGPSSLLSVGRVSLFFDFSCRLRSHFEEFVIHLFEGFFLFFIHPQSVYRLDGLSLQVCNLPFPFFHYDTFMYPRVFILVCSCHSFSVVLSACNISIILGATVRPLEGLPDSAALERWSM